MTICVTEKLVGGGQNARMRIMEECYDGEDEAHKNEQRQAAGAFPPEEHTSRLDARRTAVSNKPTLDIILRTCSRVQVLSGRQRMEGLQKFEVTLRCLRSLARSILAVPGHKDSVRLTIVDDASDPSHVAAWAALLLDMRLDASWLHVEQHAGASSFRVAIEAARLLRPNLLYFVEDDYLHYPAAILCLMESWALLQATAPEGLIALTSYDCPDRYTRPPYPSTIWFAGGRYWRTTRHTTGTFAVTRGLLDRHWDLYSRFAEYGRDSQVSEDTTLNRVYQLVPCFSPIPTLAIHLQYADTIPLVLPEGGWRGLWDSFDGGRL